jgi:hypothetical protein
MDDLAKLGSYGLQGPALTHPLAPQAPFIESYAVSENEEKKKAVENEEKKKAVENEEKEKDGAAASSGNGVNLKEGSSELVNVVHEDKDDMRMQDDDRDEEQRKVKETECAEVLLMMEKEERDILDKERAGKDGKEKQEEDVRMQEKEKEGLGVCGTVMHGVHDSALFYSMVLLQFIVEWGHSMLVVWGILKSTCWHRGWLVSTVGVG